VNIFKVLASGRFPIKEEEFSAILAWLVNPRLDHGLGTAFLSALVSAIAGCRELDEHGADLAEPMQRLATDLDRSQLVKGDAGPFHGCSLELNVGYSVIDVVVDVGDWILAFENKTRAGALSDPEQLAKQYRGLREIRDNDEALSDKHIAMLLLCPPDIGPERPALVDEYQGLAWCEMAGRDLKCLLTWRERSGREEAPDLSTGVETGIPSISQVIRSLLSNDRDGATGIPRATRWLLNALRGFMDGGGKGMSFEPTIAWGVSECESDLETLETLLAMHGNGAGGAVGIMHGLTGLLALGKDVATREFRYTEEGAAGKRGVYLDLDFFCQVATWLRDGSAPDRGIAWENVYGPLRSKHLLRIARDFGGQVYIGIQGGEAGLRELTGEEIETKRWQLGTKPASQQWITGELYAGILAEKGMV